MNCFRYKIEHDYGFAPNPFHGTLSLATCKGPIRQNKNLKVGDWIVGFGSEKREKRRRNGGTGTCFTKNRSRILINN